MNRLGMETQSDGEYSTIELPIGIIIMLRVSFNDEPNWSKASTTLSQPLL